MHNNLPAFSTLVFVFVFSVLRVCAAADSLKTERQDTAQRADSWFVNSQFSNAYLQNLRPSFAGQEYFDPNRTLLNADLAAHFVLLNTPKLPVFFVATARVNLRLLADKGSPVQSPSYMPGGTLYFRINRDGYRPRFLSVSYTHHSNGVRGPTLNRDGSFNTDSGKFTTNFYTLTFHAGKQTEKPRLLINRYDAIGIELHSGLLGEGYSEGLKGHYGFVRINGDWLYNISKHTADAPAGGKPSFRNWQRIQLQFTYIADRYDDYSFADVKKRLNINLKYYYQFPFMQNVSLVAGAGYRGQDEYNIFFRDSYGYLVLGFAAGISLGRGAGN